MIVLWILLAIIALIVILLHFSVKAYIKLDDDGFEIKAKYLWFTLYPRETKEKKPKDKRVRHKNKKQAEQEFQDNIDDDFANIKQEEVTKEENIVEKTISENKVSSEPESKTAKTKPETKHTVKTEESTKKTKQPDSDKESKFGELRDKYNKIKPYIPKGWKYFKKLLKAVRIADLEIIIDVGREDAHEAVIYYGAVQGLLFNTLGTLASIFTMKVKRADVNCVFTKNTIDGGGECYIKVRPSTLIAIAACIASNFGIIYLKQKRLNKPDKINEDIKTLNKLEVS